jgi:hypothetical protein
MRVANYAFATYHTYIDIFEYMSIYLIYIEFNQIHSCNQV